MRLPFGLSAYSRANGRLAEVRLVNCYVEQSPTSPGGTVAIPRPGLDVYFNLAPRGLHREEGFAGDQLFSVVGSSLYRNQSVVGTGVAGSDRVEWAYTVDGLFLLSGGIVYQWDNSTLQTDAFPDSAAVASIASLNSILVAVREDTGTMYFRLPGDTTWNALDFFSAERRPDPVLAVRVLGDTLYAFGSATIEMFAPTGNTGTPFQRIGGAALNRGIKDRDSLALLDNTLFFVGEDGIVYRLTEGVPARVSDHGIEERIRASETAKAFSGTWDGHSFYIMGLDAETLVYDVAGGWAQWTYDGGAFPSLGYADGERTFVAGDAIWTLAQQRVDGTDTEIERVFTAILPAEKPVSCDCIEVELSPGTAPTGSEPAILQMRWSDDQARTFTDWKEADTGFGGEYRKRVRFRRLGMADAPGRLFEFRMTDPVHIRFSGVELNPANGGRSRV